MATIEAALGRWAKRPGPLYSKLSDALRDAIDAGRLVGGERLPSERDVAERLAVSRSTVVAAYDALRSDGLLESRQGSGTRVRPASRRRPGQPGETLRVNPVYRSLMESGQDVISLACAIFPAHPRVAEALAEVAEQDVAKVLTHTGYMPAGLPELRQRLAEMHTADGTPTVSDQILVTTGAQQAVYLASMLFVHPGDEIVVESPSFAGTLDVYRTRGARFCRAPVDDDGVDARVVADLVAAHRPSAVYVMPSFHNPMGVMLSEPRRRALAALATSEQLAIIEDNALEHVLLDPDAQRLPPIAAYAPEDAPIVSAGSLSKAAWGGLRVGWLRGPAPLISRLAELKAMTDLGSPLLDQAVAARIVPQLAELREDHRHMLRWRLDVISELLTTRLPDWEWRRPRGGPSLWVRLPAGNAPAFAQVALRHGVEVIPGGIMSPDAGVWQEYFRLPFTEEPPVLEEIVRRLAAAWRAYGPREAAPDERRAVIV